MYIHSFIKVTFIVYYVPSISLCAKDLKTNKAIKILEELILQSRARRRETNKIIIKLK